MQQTPTRHSSESPMAHVATFNGRLWLIRSVLRASNFSVLKFIKIVILWVFCIIFFGFSLFWDMTCHFLKLIFWLRITDEIFVPKMRIWFILLIKSDKMVYIHLSRNFIFQLLVECKCWWTSESPRAHVAKIYGRLRLIRSVLRASTFSVLKLI